MIVYIVRCPDTVFGEVIREFDSMQQATFWMGICKRNKVKFKIECRFEDRPKQLEFSF
jgi:hypothetical protein